ncbi:Na+ dependent nucleoside transporter C-terminus-domain-containing protein [Fimicolochytrium jonesii]|uniref:Na+ dependent nucleoside transporter C-terminus-domain-containing protein n=1 Tax=Fimicolochytrium jonesii TaxID=1396493 RepID=UPI0022FF0352|nr:Na+ dependent nucleoside transporter C-terminus-domain-containing protein [Fimicolochytrium jonesii]KAI8816491.1 Na+ dependent nucleoside transporter C-terminus-domain-containing protein [Fimicolochytrium jonesii]
MATSVPINRSESPVAAAPVYRSESPAYRSESPVHVSHDTVADNISEKIDPSEKVMEVHYAEKPHVAGDEQAANVEAQKPMFGKRSAKVAGIEIGLWLCLTAYTIALWVLGKDDGGAKKDGFEFWTVCWVFVTLRVLARHVSATQLFWRPAGNAWNNTFGRLMHFGHNIVFGGVLIATLVALLLTALFTSSEESTRAERVQSWAGIIFLLAINVALSRNRRAINLQTVAVGLLLQFVFALLVLKWETGATIFRWFATFINNFLHYSHTGLEFLFGTVTSHIFVVSVFPAIIFFCSFISIIYYWGGMQYLVSTLGAAMMRLMDTSGAESVVAAASPFVGQVENALLVLPFVEYMTKSELHAILTCGFATISGSLLMVYADIVQDPRLILTACIMSIPASLVLTKLRYPEQEESLTKGKCAVPEHGEKSVNFLHAAGNGAATGAQLCILIAANLLAIISLYNAANDLVGWMFDMIDVHRSEDIIQIAAAKAAAADGSEYIPPLHPTWVTISFILSYPFFIFAWFLGVNGNEARIAGEVLGRKVVINEFDAFLTLKNLKAAGYVNNRTFRLMAFALCSFANIGSIGIQVSALGAISPSRRKDLAELAVSALIVGTMSTWLTASVAGCLL